MTIAEKIFSSLLLLLTGGLMSMAVVKPSVPAGASDVKITGEDGQGKKIIEIKGNGGKDDGIIVRGYELPKEVSSNKFPLKVYVKPNETLFDYTGGKEVILKSYLHNDIRWDGKVGDVEGEYYMWYETLKKLALGAES